jgi:Mg-chelatase subunit ChlD
MRKIIADEYKYLDKWSLNLKEDVHSRWPFDELEESIQQTENSIKQLKNVQLSLSPYGPSFLEALGDILKIKQRALDNYNPQARKSDKYGNDLYSELVNNLNEALIADYNSFVESGVASGYQGLYAFKYAPVFGVRATTADQNVSVKPFTDTPHVPIVLSKQKVALTKNAFVSLNQYVMLVNAMFAPIEAIIKKTESFSSTAATYKELASYARRKQLEYAVSGFQVPLTEYSKTIAASAALQPAIAKSLNAQATALLDIMKEHEQLIVAMDNETSTRNYEKDNLNKIYEILERQRDLILAWDERKEQLYDDVRTVFDAYPPANPGSPWYRSGQALQQLADADHKALFEAKALYKINDVSKGVDTGMIDSLVRQLVTDEFTNLKGIQRLGANNGNDPYTPYEKLPQISGVLSEKLSIIRPANSRPPGFNHPYNEHVHLYNVAVDALNKFSDLSQTTFILQMVLQPPVFKLAYPEKEVVKEATKPDSEEQPQQQGEPILSKELPVAQSAPDVLRLRDTIAIEKHDTVYIRESDINLRSMEGYAVNNLVLLIDVSGSMNSSEKLPLLKQSLSSLLSMMRPEDEVSIVVYSEKAKVLLQPTSFRDEEKVKRVIARLIAAGKTNGNAGLKMAYKVADDNYVRGGNNRIVLATDGEFPVTDELRKFIADYAGQDILLTVFNFGAKGETRDSLERLSRLGRGHFTDITKESAELDLIREVKSKRIN